MCCPLARKYGRKAFGRFRLLSCRVRNQLLHVRRETFVTANFDLNTHESFLWYCRIVVRIIN
jgi:hypothetical protein